MIEIGVMHAEVDPWSTIARKGQIPSWEAQNTQNVSIVYFYGKTNYLLGKINALVEKMRWSKFRVISYGLSVLFMIIFAAFKKYIPKYAFCKNQLAYGISGLKIKIPELTCTMRWKKLAFLKYFIDETNSEFAVITTTSSILNLNNLNHEITNLKQLYTDIYAGGPIGNSHKCQFISGSFTIMNRSAAKLLLVNLQKLPVHMMDDVGFGSAFKQLKIIPIQLSSISFESAQNMQIESLTKFCHYRFKSGNLKNRNDVKLMQYFLSKIRFTW